MGRRSRFRMATRKFTLIPLEHPGPVPVRLLWVVQQLIQDLNGSTRYNFTGWTRLLKVAMARYRLSPGRTAKPPVP